MAAVLQLTLKTATQTKENVRKVEKWKPVKKGNGIKRNANADRTRFVNNFTKKYRYYTKYRIFRTAQFSRTSGTRICATR